MKVRIKGNENKFYVGLIVVIVVCFITFFTSKMWMYDDSDIMQTPFYTELSGLDQTALILHKWEYNPENMLMEVTLETKHIGSDQVKPTFTFEAKERESLEEYPVKVVYKDDINIVVQIQNVPETYHIIGLFVYEHRDKKMIESELKMTSLNSSGSIDQDENHKQLELPKPKEKIIVGDYRKIKINPDLEIRSAIEYQIENIKREIHQIEQKIEALEKEHIPLQKQLIKEIEREIEVLKNEQQYQTETEKMDSEARIASKKDTIKNTIKQQEDYEKEVKTLKEKREKLLVKLQDISSENTDKKSQKKSKNEQKNDNKSSKK